MPAGHHISYQAIALFSLMMAFLISFVFRSSFFVKFENVSLEISFWVVVFFSGGTLNKNEARPWNGAGKEKWEVGLLRFTRSFLMREEFSEKGLVSSQASIPVWLGIGRHRESSLSCAIKNKDKDKDEVQDLLWEIHLWEGTEWQPTWMSSTINCSSERGLLKEFRDCKLGITTRYQDFLGRSSSLHFLVLAD